MIRFEKVTKRYPNDYVALHQVNFHMAAGEMVFVTGHSGAGKTTLLRLLTRLECCTEGRILVNDYDLKALPKRKIPNYRRRIGIISQNPRLLMDNTVYDNVALPLVIAGYQQQEIARRVRAALDKVGLLKREQYFPHALSCGEQQRVNIARAIVNKPTLILADEPTGNLDPDLSEEIMNLFESFNQVGVSILIASHDLALIGRLKHRIMTLHQGRLVSSGVGVADDC